jgi:transcription antitermination factor NusG
MEVEVEEINDNPGRWFAVRVKPRAEKMVATQVRYKGYDEFLPLYKDRRRWSDRFQWVELPLFPGYVFCRLTSESRLPILTIPGVINFVGIGKAPAAIDDAEIAAIQATTRSGMATEPWPFLSVGQRVRVAEGPLTGMEGLLVEARKRHRIIVSVSLLQRSMAVEIERDWVRPLDSAASRFRSQFKPTLADLASFQVQEPVAG